MFAFFNNLLLLSAEGATKSGGFTEFYEKYFNISGFELWKFINLAIFVGFMIYVLKKPLSEAFKAKREAIRSELIKAEEAKQAALAQLTSAVPFYHQTFSMFPQANRRRRMCAPNRAKKVPRRLSISSRKFTSSERRTASMFAVRLRPRIDSSF